MALKLTSFTLTGDTMMIIGHPDYNDGKPCFDVHFITENFVDINPAEMNDLIQRMMDDLYDMKMPEPVKCENGSTYIFVRDRVIERFMKDNAEEVNAGDRAQAGSEGREDAQ